MMCDFCDDARISEDTQQCYESNIDFGVFGMYTLSATLWPGKLQIAIDNVDCHDMFTGDIPIKYCPFCGRRLGEMTYTRDDAQMRLSRW